MRFLISELEWAMVLFAMGVIAVVCGAILFGYGVAEFFFVIWEVLFAKKKN